MPKRRREASGISDLQYLVLNSLIPNPLYGYAIRREVKDRTEGQIEPSLATLYDILHRSLEDGLIERAEDVVIDGRLRRTYRITSLGEKAMSDKRLIAAALLKPRTLTAGI